MLDLTDEPEPFRVTPGFIAFAAAMLLPLLAAVLIFTGAALVAPEVRAAEAGRINADGSITLYGTGDDVAGWKKALVGVCPAH